MILAANLIYLTFTPKFPSHVCMLQIKEIAIPSGGDSLWYKFTSN